MRSGPSTFFFQHTFLPKKQSKRCKQKTDNSNRNRIRAAYVKLIIKCTKLLIVIKVIIITGLNDAFFIAIFTNCVFVIIMCLISNHF